MSPGPDPRWWTPRRRPSCSISQPEPASAGLGTSFAPSTPCQKRRARPASSAGNSISGAGIGPEYAATEGPLAERELERARAWGESLVELVRRRSWDLPAARPGSLAEPEDQRRGGSGDTGMRRASCGTVLARWPAPEPTKERPSTADACEWAIGRRDGGACAPDSERAIPPCPSARIAAAPPHCRRSPLGR